MSYISTIEKALIALDEGNMHTIAGQYLKSRYGGALSDFGRTPGKAKTKPGRPDLAIEIEGRYITAEVTTMQQTNKTQYERKLKSDLQSMLREPNAPFPLESVERVVLILNSVPSAPLQAELRAIAQQEGKPLDIVTLSELTVWLNNTGRYLASELLHIPFDTEQVLSLQKFIEVYGQKTPTNTISNQFFGREQEIGALSQMILDNKLTFVTGLSGIGKTKLTVQTCAHIIQTKPGFESFAITHRPTDVFQSLKHQLNQDKKYVLFIDDTNHQIASLLEALTFIDHHSQIDIHIVATLRHYAVEKVEERLGGRTFKTFSLQPLPTDTIKAILQGPDFSITDEAILEQIIKIAGQNFRFAVMAARVHQQDPGFLLDNAVKIYEFYFKHFFLDTDLFKDLFTSKVMAIMAFFETLDIASINEGVLLNQLAIGRVSFEARCKELEKLEFLECRYQTVYKFPDQNLRTYYFYKGFIEKRLLSFDQLLSFAMKGYYYRVLDGIEGVSQAMGEAVVTSAIKDLVASKMDALSLDDDLYSHYLKVFGKFFPFKSISYTNHLIEKFKEPADRHLFASIHVRQIQQLMEPLLAAGFNQDFKLAVAVLEKVYLKDPSQRTHLAQSLQTYVAISERDLVDECRRQAYLLDREEASIKNDTPLLFLCDANYTININNSFAKELFQQNERKEWHLKPTFATMRKRYWQGIANRLVTHRQLSLRQLAEYVGDLRHRNFMGNFLTLWEYDIVKAIIHEHLDVDIFKEAFLAEQYLKYFAKVRPKDKSLRELFFSQTVQLYKILNLAHGDYPEIERATDYEKSVRPFQRRLFKKNLTIDNKAAARHLCRLLIEIGTSPYRMDNRFSSGCDEFFAYLFSLSPTIGLHAVGYYLQHCGEPVFSPYVLYQVAMSGPAKYVHALHKLIASQKDIGKSRWLTSFFTTMPNKKSLINHYYPQLLIYYREAQLIVLLNFEYLDKYRIADENVFRQVLNIVVDRRKKDNTFKYRCFHYFFSKLVDQYPELLPEVEEAYLQCLDMDSHIDLDAKDLAAIVQHKKDFLLRYLKHLTHTRNIFKDRPLTFIWKQDDSAELALAAFNFLITKSSELFDYRASAFLADLQADKQPLVLKTLEQYMAHNIDNVAAINFVLETYRNAFAPLYPGAIQKLVKLGPPMDVFSKLRWFNNHFTASERNYNWHAEKFKLLSNVVAYIQQLDEPLHYLPYVEKLQELMTFEQKLSIDHEKYAYMLNY